MCGGGGGVEVKPRPLQMTVNTKKQRRWVRYHICLFDFAPSPTGLSFIPHILLQHLSSFRAFSCSTMHLLLRNLVSISIFSYRTYLHSSHSPTALKEWRRHGKKMQLWKDPVKENGQSLKNWLLKWLDWKCRLEPGLARSSPTCTTWYSHLIIKVTGLKV